MDHNPQPRNSRESQCSLILKHLQDGRTLTPLEALERFCCLSLAQRIKNLRDDGWPIKTEMVKTPSGKRVARYSYWYGEQLSMKL